MYEFLRVFRRFHYFGRTCLFRFPVYAVGFVYSEARATELYPVAFIVKISETENRAKMRAVRAKSVPLEGTADSIAASIRLSAAYQPG